MYKYSNNPSVRPVEVCDVVMHCPLDHDEVRCQSSQHPLGANIWDYLLPIIIPLYI